MEKRGSFTKGLAIAGVVLVWAPIAFMFLIAIPRWMNGVFIIDYLIPAELFPVALVGGMLLIWAAVRAHARKGLIGGGAAIGAAMLGASLLLASVTGLASGESEAEGWRLWLVAGAMAIYTLSLIEIGGAGIALLRDMMVKAKDTNTPAPTA